MQNRDNFANLSDGVDGELLYDLAKNDFTDSLEDRGVDKIQIRSVWKSIEKLRDGNFFP